MVNKADFWREGWRKLQSSGVPRGLAGRLIKATGDDYDKAMKIVDSVVADTDPVKYLCATITDMMPAKPKPKKAKASIEPSIEEMLRSMGYVPIRLGDDRWSAGDYVYNSKGEVVGG